MLKIPPNNPNTSVENIPPSRVNNYRDGELARIKVLEHLGGGKLIIALKGHRIVANTDLMLENGQEMDVIVKNIGNKITLRLTNLANYETVSAPDIPIKTSIADVLNQFLVFINKTTLITLPSLDESLKQLLQKIKKSINLIPVNVSEPNLAEQIHKAIEKIGYGYEHKIADDIAKGQLKSGDSQTQLKSELLNIQSYLSNSQIENKSIRVELTELVRKALESIEFQQINLLPHTSDVQHIHHFHIQIPIIIQDNIISTELEFFRQKGENGSEDEAFNIILNLNMESLGNIIFALNVNGININCQVKTDNSETYILIEKYSNELIESLAALGYKTDRIKCIREYLGTNEEKSPILSEYRVIDNIDIVV